MMNLRAEAGRVHAWAVGKGFYNREHLYDRGENWEAMIVNPSLPAEKLALIHSEVSEVLEALRDEDRQHEAEECADVLIRLLDYCGWRGIDLERHFDRKMEINLQRPHLHGRNF
jgi:NTP pyrophosphatase (non-canonical NTP hydrolase)